MCGRYGFSVKDAKEVYERFDVYNELADLTARYNIAPGQMNPVITSRSPNEISRMFWGLIPHWAKDDSSRYKTINARAETVAQLPTYREPFRHKRCIVPATGFYEPDKINFKKAPFPPTLSRVVEHFLESLLLPSPLKHLSPKAIDRRGRPARQRGEGL